MEEFQVETIGPSGDCAVLRVTGEVDVYTAPVLRERIRDLAAKGVVHVIADLSRVDFLDSTGLGVLVGGLKRLREHGGSLTPVITTTRILRILQITGLTKVLPPQPSVLDAIGADPHWRRTAESEAGTADQWCRQHGLL
jgi:anti-sigma B factor antagonist